MESKTKAFGHPIHPMLIVFPVGLFAMAVISDILYLITQSSIFPVVSFIDIAGGIIGGLLAAIVGLRDYLVIPGGTRAKSVAANHGLLNVAVVVLFAVSWLIRNTDSSIFPSGLAMIFSFAGILLICYTAWLGGELVDRLGVGVDPGANLNAPSSLSKEAAEPVTGPISQGTPRVEAIPITGDRQVEAHEEGLAEEHDVDEP